MALTKIGSIGINTGIQFGVTTISTLNSSSNVLSVGGTVNFWRCFHWWDSFNWWYINL